MQPFLPSSASYWSSHRHVPSIDLHAPNVHTQERAALDDLRLALEVARRIFGKYQLAEMLNEEMHDMLPVYDSHYPIRCRDGAIVSAQAGRYCHTVRDDEQRVYTHVEVWAKRDGIRFSEEPECLSAHELMALLEAHGGVVDGHLPPLDFGRAPERRKRARDGDMADYEFRKARKEHGLPYTKEFKGTLDSHWVYKDLTFQKGACSVIQTPGIRVEGVKADGTSLATSRLKSVTYNNGVHILETRNSFYAAFEEDRKRVRAAVRTSPDGNVTLSVVPALTPLAPGRKHVAGL